MSRSRTDHFTPRSRGRTGVPILAVAIQVLLQAACTGGVLPEGLKKSGSAHSIEYVADELLPNQGTEIALLGPRLGDPALLAPDATDLEVTFYVADPSDAAQVEPLLTMESVSDYPALSGSLPADAEPLSLLGPVNCDDHRICRARVALPRDLPEDEPVGLCLRLGQEASCSPGALDRFDDIPNPLRIAVLSDLHLGKSGVTGRIAPLFEAVESQDTAAHLIVITGDLTDQGQPDLLTLLLHEAARSHLPVIILPGNHDFKHGHIDDYLQQVTPRLDHAHVLGPYLLITLNTGPGRWDQDRLGSNAKGMGIEAGQLDWVRNQLTGHPEAPARILFLHHPPYSSIGSVFSHRRKALVSLCHDQGVSLMVAGHTHMLEVADRHGFTQGLSIWEGTDLPKKRMPITLVSARSTDRTYGGFRFITLQPDGMVSYQWRRVRLP